MIYDPRPRRAVSRWLSMTYDTGNYSHAASRRAASPPEVFVKKLFATFLFDNRKRNVILLIMRIRKCKTGFMYAKTKVFNDVKKQQQKMKARKKIRVFAWRSPSTR